MKKHIYMMATALVIGVAAPVAAQDDFASFSEDMLGMLSSDGATVSFDERNVDDDGSVELVGFSLVMPDGNVTVRADWIKGVPSATTPGQVTLTLSPSASVTFISPNTGEHIINISNEGLVVTLDGITSGQDAETLNFSVMASSIGFTSGNPEDTVLKALDVALNDLSQTVVFSPASKMVRGETSILSMGIIYDITPPDDSQMASNSETVDLNLSFQLIADNDDQNFIDYLSGASTAFIDLSTGMSKGSGKSYSPEAQLAYSGSSASGTLSVRAENGRVSLEQIMGETEYSFSEFIIGGMPLPPFDASVESLTVKLSAPTAPSEAFSVANIVFALRNLEVSESIYAMLDPDQAIPRGPVNMVVDLSANVKSNMDWDNPDAAMGSGNPADIAEVQDITINEVLFTAGGAQITAKGDATIDNTQGFPLPTGMVTINAAGIQALVNGIVELGFIPQEQAGMMMGLLMAFAKPGENPDEFISEIEFSPQGITANGVPLPM
ncbi:MAG: DUF2125 domain-containing protein [Rhodobacteraceae bacterium]|nr:DUF2125 domain-containing protein [Paracoccaceae bacterium]